MQLPLRVKSKIDKYLSYDYRVIHVWTISDAVYHVVAITDDNIIYCLTITFYPEAKHVHISEDEIFQV